MIKTRSEVKPITIKLFKMIFCVVMLCFSFSLLKAAENDKIIRLTSLEWKPYTGSDLLQNGFSAAVVEAAYAAMGYKLEIHFYPWRRAIHFAENEPEYHGYFPEYYSEEVARIFLFSDKYGKGPLGTIVNIEADAPWETLEDLKKYKIGVVEGYVNTEEFDNMMHAGEVNVEKVNDDATNIKKVGEGRIDLALMDEYVFLYLIDNEPELKQYKGKVKFQKVLAEKDLYVCFKTSPEGSKARAIFNEGLKKINIKEIVKSNQLAQAQVSLNYASEIMD